jgi:hypothetical protein
MNRLLIVMLLGFVTQAHAAGAIIACKGADGKMSFSDKDCKGTDTRVEQTVKPANVVSTEGLREWSHKNPIESVPDQPPPQQARQSQPFHDPVACENARRSYSFAAGWRFTSPAELASARQEVAQKCGSN